MSISKTENPGPGNYNLHSARNGPSYAFGGKSKGKMNENPGPGSYTVDITVNKVGGGKYKIGTASRSSQFLNRSASDLPGPGNYESNKSSLNARLAYKFGTSNRPGVNNKNPGPGEYDEQYYKGNKSSSKIGNSKRGNIIDKEKSELPGPGNYENKSTFNDKSYKFGNSNRPQISTISPGPGSYEASN